VSRPVARRKRPWSPVWPELEHIAATVGWVAALILWGVWRRDRARASRLGDLGPDLPA
jgi:hypothetical protein